MCPKTPFQLLRPPILSRWAFKAFKKILVNKILLSPMRENIKCPKALPRFRLRCFGASGFGSAKLRQLTLWSGTKEPGQGTSLSDFSIEAETCDIRNCGFLHSGFEHWAHLAPAFEVAFPPWNYQNLPFFVGSLYILS